MKKGEFLYEGKAKRLYKTDHPDVLWLEYKDDATAFNGQKRASLTGKGQLNNAISSWFFTLLSRHGIQHHFLDTVSDREQLVRPVTILPLEVVVRAIAAGSLCRRLGLAEGTRLPQVLVEWYYKDDALGDPLVTEDHIALLQLATPVQLAFMKDQALQIHTILQQALEPKGIVLVDFKLEFGLDANGRLMLADEISPDTCRFWDAASGKKMDKDRFRQDLGGTLEGYQEILERLGGGANV